MSLIDSNIAIELRDGNPVVAARITVLAARPALSIMTQIELESGVHAVPRLAALRRARTDTLLGSLKVLALDDAIVATYGQIVRACGYSRSRLLDRLIAATAIVHDLTLITINGDDFRDIPGLVLEVWPAPAQ